MNTNITQIKGLTGRLLIPALLSTATALSFAPSRAEAHAPKCRHGYRCACGCGTTTACRCPSLAPVQEYYHAWAPTIRLVRETIYELPAGYQTVHINGIEYYTYPRGEYRGRYFRALGETAGVTYITPP